MALDRFVYWKDERPTDEQLKMIVEDFFGGAGTLGDNYMKADGRPWWIVSLPGAPSHPLRRAFGLGKDMPTVTEENDERDPVGKERWIEVYVAANYIDVMTRQMDHYTHCLAEGLANILCKAFKGERREPDDFEPTEFGDTEDPAGPV